MGFSIIGVEFGWDALSDVNYTSKKKLPKKGLFSPENKIFGSEMGC